MNLHPLSGKTLAKQSIDIYMQPIYPGIPILCSSTAKKAGGTLQTCSEVTSLSLVALYCRVSTDEQAQRGYSIDNQRDRLVAYCHSQGWDHYELYIDDGYTGTNLNRPALQRLLSDVRRGQAKIVVVYKLDRLSRRQRDVLHLLEDEFEARDVAFKSATEPFDTSTPLGKAMLGILAVFAQLERDTIVQRLSTGLKQRVKSGKWPGGRVPFGYRYNRETGRLEIRWSQADLVRRVFQQYLEGASLHQLALWLAEQSDDRSFDHAAIRQLLQRRVYIGESTFGDTVSSEIVSQPIVDIATFERVQAEIQRRHQEKSPTGEYLLTGLLRCSQCGSAFVHVRRRNPRRPTEPYDYYACKTQHQRCAQQRSKCSVGYRRRRDLEGWVVSQLITMVETHRFRETLVNQLVFESQGPLPPLPTKSNVLSELQEDLKRVEKETKRWYDAFGSGRLEEVEVRERIENLARKGEIIRRRMQKLRTEPLPNEKPQDAAQDGRQFRTIWESLSFLRQRRVLQSVITVIELGPRDTEPTIVWNRTTLSNLLNAQDGRATDSR